MSSPQWTGPDGNWRPPYCIECFDGEPTHELEGWPADLGPLVCETCARLIPIRRAKHRACVTELDRHGYRINKQLRSLLIDLLCDDKLPDAAPETLQSRGIEWFAQFRGVGPATLTELSRLQRSLGRR